MTLVVQPEGVDPSRVGRSLSLVLLPFVGVLALAWLPILTSKIPPLGDYYNHLARMHVIALNGRDPLLAHYYEVDWQLIPNLAMDLIVPPLVAWFGIYTAGKLFILFYTGLLLTGPHAIHYALFRRLSLGPLAAALFLYNQIQSYGNINYLCGLGVALWGIACAIRLRRSRPVLRIAVSLLFTLALFACHLFALGLYGLTVLCLELTEHRQRPIASDLLVAGAAFAVVPILLAFSPTSGFIGDTEWQLGSKLQGLFFAVKTYNGPVDLTVAAIMSGALLYAWRHRMVMLHPAGVALLVACVPIYLVMPVELMSSWGADLRLPVAVIFILTGFLHWRLRSGRAQAGFIAAIAVLLVVRIAVVEQSWTRLDRIAADMRRSLALVEPGSRILVAMTDHPSGSYASNIPLIHMPMQAVIERSSFVSNTFAHPGQQPIRIRPEYQEFANELGHPVMLSALVAATGTTPRPGVASGARSLRGWQQHFDDVYLLLTDDEPNPLPGILVPLHRGERFQLYRVVHGG